MFASITPGTAKRQVKRDSGRFHGARNLPLTLQKGKARRTLYLGFPRQLHLALPLQQKFDRFAGLFAVAACDVTAAIAMKHCRVIAFGTALGILLASVYGHISFLRNLPLV
jgi:hypothetical protein